MQSLAEAISPGADVSCRERGMAVGRGVPTPRPLEGAPRTWQPSQRPLARLRQSRERPCSVVQRQTLGSTAWQGTQGRGSLPPQETSTPPRQQTPPRSPPGRKLLPKGLATQTHYLPQNVAVQVSSCKVCLRSCLHIL